MVSEIYLILFHTIPDANTSRFKLHLRPKSLASSHVNDQDLPLLPRNKTAVGVFADFMKYLFQCAIKYIQETHANGPELWKSVERHVEFVLSHPNGWEGVQQNQMRQAAVLAGLFPDTQDGQARLQFVTEGEASLHFCIGNGLSTSAMMVRVQLYFLFHIYNYDTYEPQSGEGVIIVDAGGGTIDLSAYRMTSPPNSFEEIAPPECE